MPEGRQKFRSSLFKGLQVQGSALVAPAGAKGPGTLGLRRGLGQGERPLRGNPSVACGRHLPFQGRHGLRAAYGGWPWGCFAALWRNDLRRGMYQRTRALPFYQAVRPRSKNSGVVVRLGPIAGFLPTGQEAQTAAGVRSSRYLPKTARRRSWRAHFGTTGLKPPPSPPPANPKAQPSNHPPLV